MTDKQKKRNLFCFPIGTLGRDMVYNLFTNFILVYVLFTHKLTAAQLMAITGIMVGARIFDALNDPIMGNIIERTRTRWGKYKPWLVIGILSTSVVVYLAFNVKLEGWSFVWFFGVIYFCYSITYTMHDIAYWGMIPSLGSDGATRDKLTSITNLVAGIGGGLAGLCIPMFTTGSNAIGGNTQTAYGIVSLVIVILAPLFLSFTIFGAKEDRSYMDEPAPPISFKKIVGTIKNNDQLLWIAVMFLIQQIGADMIVGGIGSTYIYFNFGYEGGLYSIFSTVGLSASALLMIGYPWLSRKWTRKQLMKGFTVLGMVGFGVMLVAGLLLGHSMLAFWIMTVSYMLAYLCMNCFYLIMMISILNTVEYNEYKHGTRDEAIIASLRPFLTKLASAIVVLMTSVSYLLLGVTDYTNKIAEYEQLASMGSITESEKLSSISSVLAQITGGQSTGLLLVMVLIPVVSIIVSYAMYKKHYKLDEDEYNRIIAELGK